MKRNVILALPVLAVLCSVSLGQAQQPAPNPVPFTATLTGTPPEQFEIPVDPPVYSQKETVAGQGDLIGAVQWVGHAMQSGGPDFRTPRLLSEGVGAMTAASGDAIFFRYSGKVIPGIDSQNRELAFVITGGKGRYLGATGTGLFKDSIDFSMNRFTRTIEGSITIPVAK
jgi:hypothetical protein